MGRDVRSALASKVVLLDRMKNVAAFLKVVFNVGKEVTEVIIRHDLLPASLIFPS